MVALAGPLMNLFLALVAAFVLGIVLKVSPELRIEGGIFVDFLLLFTSLNVLLAIFNLIPLPPLDGSRLLTIFLPHDKQKIIFFLDQYGFLILLALVFFGALEFLSPIIDQVRGWVLDVTGAIEPRPPCKPCA
jgi:Zn-dependent protease